MASVTTMQIKQIRTLLSEGQSVKAIAQTMQWTREKVYYVIARHLDEACLYQARNNSDHRLSDEDKQTIVAMAHAKHNATKISKAVGCQPRTVREYLKSIGLWHNKCREWTHDELALLTSLLDKSPDERWQAFPNRTRVAVLQQSFMLRQARRKKAPHRVLTTYSYQHWSQEELATLEAVMNASPKERRQALPYRTGMAIEQKIFSLRKKRAQSQ